MQPAPLTPKLFETHMDEINVCVAKIENAMEDRNEAIKQAYQDNVPVKDIAGQAKISRQRVWQIVSWGH